MDQAADSTTPFSADRPIEHASDDRLGRTAFAYAIANAISTWQGRDSLVIALYGPWGAGKSSVKNLAVEALRRLDGPATVVEFNPWEWSGSAELRNAFFEQIGKHLGLADPSGKARDLQKQWEYYAAFFGDGASPTDATVRWMAAGVSALAGLSVVQSLLANPSVDKYGRVALVAVAVIAGLVAGARTISSYVSKFLRARVALKEMTVVERKAKLASELRKLKKPIVIVIDDLDRLMPNELRTITQLVKANADLPNMVYLLLGDRQLLATALSYDGLDGAAYLEKIIQAPFDLPIADQRQVDEILFTRLNTVLARPGVDAHFERQRWATLYLEALRPYFTSIRHVNRFTSTLDFHSSVFLAGTTLEVNVVDLIALEVLRVFEPSVYQRLPSLKQILTSPIEKDAGLLVTTDEAAHAAIDPVVESVPEARRDRVKAIFQDLFPYTSALWKGPRRSKSHEDDWLVEMRVASEERFDRYFQLAIPKGDISQAAIASILANAGSRNRTCSTLIFFHKEGLLPKLFDILDGYKQSIAPADVVPFCTAVFDVGDLVPRRSEADFFGMGTDQHAVRVVRWALKGLENVDAREEAFEKAVADSTGLYLPVMRVKLEEDIHRETPTEGLVREAALQKLRTRCVEKVAASAAAGTLQKNRHMAYIVWRWHNWGGADVVPAWISSLIRSPEGTLDLLRGFTDVGQSVEAGDRVPRTHRFLRLNDLEGLVSFDGLERALASAERLTLSEQDRELLVTARQSFERLKSDRSGEPIRS